MHLLWLSAPALAFVLLGAHFWRAGVTIGVLLCVLAMALLALPRAWAARAVQLALWLGALEWLWTAFGLVQARRALGLPWLRLGLVLGAVALATAAASFVFGQRRLRARYALDRRARL